MSEERREHPERVITGPPVTIGFRLEKVRGGHCDVGVFVGRNPGARGKAGTIVLRVEEFDELRDIAALGGPIAVDTQELDGARE